MDWNLSFVEGRPYVFRCKPLRKARRMVSNDSYLPYYAAVVADVFLRFLWTLTLAPSATTPFGAFVDHTVSPFLSYAEIFRRTMWSIFRIEAEHLKNTASYGKVDIVPLHFEQPESSPFVPKRSWLTAALEVGVFISIMGLTYGISFATHS